jgi:signal transduction histidine kinase
VAAVLFAFITALGMLTLGATTIVGELRKRRQDVVTLTDQLAAEARELEAANVRLRELDQMKNFFIGVAAHDLKAPLDAVRSLLNVILDGYTGKLTERQRTMLGRANLRIGELATLVDDFLDVSLIESGRMVVETEKMQLLEVVDDCLEDVAVLAREANVEVTLERPDMLPEIQGSPRRLRQVLTNLVSNGIKFTPSGGHVTIRVTDHPRHMQVDVVDTGVGIAPEDLPHIFETFYRAEKARAIKGTGLGLAIARQIVEEHEGRIWVKSPLTDDQRGSQFSFTLPKSLSLRPLGVAPNE